MQQLSLFNTSDIGWNDITEDWLLNYLQSMYSDLKFAPTSGFNDDEVWIRQTASKNARLVLYIKRDNDLKIWQNPTLVHLSVERRHHGYTGESVAVNNFDDFYKTLANYVKKFEEWKN